MLHMVEIYTTSHEKVMVSFLQADLYHGTLENNLSLHNHMQKQNIMQLVLLQMMQFGSNSYYLI